MRPVLVLLIVAVGGVASAEDGAVATLRREHVDAAKLAALPASATLDEVIAALADPWTRRLAPAAARAFVADVSEQTTVGVGLPELLAIDLDPSGRYPMVVTPPPGSRAAPARPRRAPVCFPWIASSPSTASPSTDSAGARSCGGCAARLAAACR